MDGAVHCSLDQEITASATTELLQGSCMAGETIPIRISIQHAKHVKNMQGIIITLFRQGRIDTHPAIPLGQCRRGKKVEYEDYYPRSRTGLGGLSLSSAGSSRSFRQDLNQLFAPIIVDPHTHTYVVNTSLPVPVDLFPTISCVPGAMISFNYYVEIVVDLRTKVGSQDRIRPHLSMTSTQQHSFGDPRISKYEDAEGVSYSTTPGCNCLITDQLRRTKGVIFTRTEVVIGTRDSTSKRSKQKQEGPDLGGELLGASLQLGREQDPQDPEFDQERQQSSPESREEDQQTIHSSDRSQPFHIPPPDPEDHLDEKERLRRAAQRLLPSAPPQIYSASPSEPSAPPAIDEEDFIRRYGLGPAAPAYGGSSSGFFAHSDGATPNHVAPSAPGPQDDKQELERHRLLALASSPPAEALGDGTLFPQRGLPPSALVLFEDDVFSLNDPRIPQAEQDLIPVDEIADEEQSCHSEIVAHSTPNNEDLHTEDASHEAPRSSDPTPVNDILPVYQR